LTIQNELRAAKSVDIAALLWFRLLLGVILLWLVSRYFWYGWISRYYIEPQIMLSFWPFSQYFVDGLPRLSGLGFYALFGGMAAASVAIILGYHYRVAVGFFFLAFTYIEVLDFTHYLNHHYLIWLLLIIAFFAPCHRSFSLDVGAGRVEAGEKISAEWLYLLRFQLFCVYFFAGLAKVQTDWLIEAQPLKIWLARSADFPLIGGLLATNFAAFSMSWAGAIYDLLIGFALLYAPTRKGAYFLVIVFHAMTYALFDIGIFPFVMVGMTTLFFEPKQHQQWIFWLKKGIDKIIIFNLSKLKLIINFVPQFDKVQPNYIATSTPLRLFFAAYIGLQIYLPLRSHFIGRQVLWDEIGFRFSWRVLLIEKSGAAIFTVRDAITGQESEIDNKAYLTDKQEFMMQTQADFMIVYAHFLAAQYKAKGYAAPQVFVRSRVAINGGRSQSFFRPDIDLAAISAAGDWRAYILPQSAAKPRKREGW
jgi:hypothetical protein